MRGIAKTTRSEICIYIFIYFKNRYPQIFNENRYTALGCSSIFLIKIKKKGEDVVVY